MTRTAYVDESARISPDAARYVLAAVIVPDEASDEVRDRLRSATPRQQRFHWHDESPSRRREFLTVATGFGFEAVVVAAAIDGRRVERARRRCLGRLLWELDQQGIRAVVFESRQANLNAADRSAVGFAQRAGQVSRELRYLFGLPSGEPLLWLPDAIAGATSAALAARETSPTGVRIVELDPR